MTGTTKREILNKLFFVAACGICSLIFAGIHTANAEKIGDLRVTNQSGISIILSEDELLKLPRSSI